MSCRVFVISLETRAAPRVAVLMETLTDAGFEAELLPGVRGRSLDAGTYFDRIQPFRVRRGHTMTPSELGCALSHVKALHRLVESGVDRALILEDDVLLDGTSIARLRTLCSTPAYDGGLLILGGQEGLEHLISTVHGKLLDPDNEVWELFNGDLKHVHRTVGYQISRTSARSLLALSSECVFVVDDYTFIAQNSEITEFFLANCVGHPRDFSDSSIEAERRSNRQGNRILSRPLRLRIFDEVRATLIGKRDEKLYSRLTAGYDCVRWSSRF